MRVIKNESEFSMIDWWKKVFLENYANFEGRARRSEYWYFVLFNFLITLSAYIVSFLLILFGGFLLWFFIPIFSLLTIIPSLAAQVRRLHDTNKSGWWLLIAFIPFGAIVLLIFYFTEGDRGSNQYGTDPKMEIEPEIDNIGRNY